MASDERCPFYINGLCYEMVTHGFSEEQLRERGEMKACEMGAFNGHDIMSFSFCATYQSNKYAQSVPGIISSICVEVVYSAKYLGETDGEIVDLKSIR